MHPPKLLVLFPILFAAGAAAAQRQTQWARTVAPRPDQTIFTELDLPTPTRLRTAAGAPGPDYWQQQADYVIDASLDPATRTVRGKERVTYTNHSPEQLDYLWVELEQNILRPDSISSRIGGGFGVGGPSEPSDGVRIKELTAAGAPLRYTVYDTMMRVELPAPIAAAGGRFVFDVAWEFMVPERVFRRYGTLETKKGIVWEIAQWFPAVAVYDDVHGWNTLPYLGTGEFYSNFGDYDVHITVPRDHVVVATGVLQNPQEVYTEEQQRRLANARTSAETVTIIGKDEAGTPASRPAGDGPLTWHYKAEKVRTFAWAASPAFVFDAASLDGKLIQSAYPEEALPVWGKSTQMLRAAIAGYSQRWYPYAYPVATNVYGVEGGMEYPMIIFCRGRNERGVFGVTAHEIGHNWFPMLVNTDERRYAWMDEGFNTFINGYAEQDWFKQEEAAPADGDGGGRGRRGRRGGGMGSIGGGVPIATEADQLSGMMLGLLEYQKTGAGLRLLRETILGPERFDYAFRTYIRRWAFKSPQPADFFRTMEDASGMDLDWFFRGWFVEAAQLDQAVDNVEQPDDHRPGRIAFTNLDRMVMPLHYEVTFKDGTTELRDLPVQAWFSTNRFVDTLDNDKEIQQVVVDPDHVLPDKARANNTWKAQ